MNLFNPCWNILSLREWENHETMKTNEVHEIQEAQNVTNAFPGAETAVGIA